MIQLAIACLLCSLAASVLEEEFTGAGEVACLAAGEHVVASPEQSAVSCAVACLEQSSCCGFSFNTASVECLLLNLLPPNIASVAGGACVFYRRNKCRDSPVLFSTVVRVAPGRVFYVSNETTSVADAPAFCEGHGGRVAEEYPAEVFHALIEELKKLFTTRYREANPQVCKVFSVHPTTTFCAGSSGLVTMSNGSRWWPNQGVVLDVERYESLGVDVHDQQSYPTIVTLYDNATDASVSSRIGTINWYTRKVLGVCEFEYLSL